MTARALDVAQHEAAHVVVGVSLGLILSRATALPKSGDYQGCTWFESQYNRRSAFATMFAAGIAWDSALGLHPRWSSWDRKHVRDHCASRHDVYTHIRAAGALLTQLSAPHALVTRALLERDVTGADIARLARGGRIDDDA